MLLEHPSGSVGHPARPTSRPAPDATVSRLPLHVVRCSCEHCGAHTNAVVANRAGESCPTCGSYRLTPIAGAEPLAGLRRTA